MKIFPAIDLIGGKVVRLSEGDYDKRKNYSLSPLEAAESFRMSGASNIHIVDLDGAKSGNADNAGVISQIVKKFDMFAMVIFFFSQSQCDS